MNILSEIKTRLNKLVDDFIHYIAGTHETKPAPKRANGTKANAKKKKSRRGKRLYPTK